jgi:hypothetical protein
VALYRRNLRPKERLPSFCNLLSSVGVNIDGVLDWMIGFIDTLFTHLRTADNYSGLADLHTLQFTVTYALGFSVFTSLILAAVCNSLAVTSNHT